MSLLLLLLAAVNLFFTFVNLAMRENKMAIGTSLAAAICGLIGLVGATS